MAVEADNEYECVSVLQDHTQDVKMVAWHPSDDVGAPLPFSPIVPCGFFFTPCPSFFFCFLADSLQVLASCSYDDTIRLWKEDDDDWQCVTTLSGHTSTVWSIAFSPNGSHLASVSDDKSLKVWESQPDQSWKCVSTIPDAHTRAIYSVSWSKDNLLATAGGDNCIKIFHKV